MSGLESMPVTLAALSATRVHEGKETPWGEPYVRWLASPAPFILGADLPEGDTSLLLATMWTRAHLSHGAQSPATMRAAGIDPVVVGAVEVFTRRSHQSDAAYAGAVLGNRYALAVWRAVACAENQAGRYLGEGRGEGLRVWEVSRLLGVPVWSQRDAGVVREAMLGARQRA